MPLARRLTRQHVCWGLDTPAGPRLEQFAAKGKPVYEYTRGFKGEDHLDFTFSGLKTAVINHMHNMDQKKEKYNKADIAASFQKEAVEFPWRTTLLKRHSREEHWQQ